MPRYGSRRAGKRRFQIENEAMTDKPDQLDLEKLCPELADIGRIVRLFKSDKDVTRQGKELIWIKTFKHWHAIARRFLDMDKELNRANAIIEKNPNYKERCPYCKAPLYGMTDEVIEKLHGMYNKAMKTKAKESP